MAPLQIIPSCTGSSLCSVFQSAGVSHPAGLITAEYFFQDWVVTNFPVLLTTSPSQNNWLNPPPISPLSEADTTANGWDVLKVTRIPPSKTLEPSGDWKYSTLPLRQPSPRLTHFLHAPLGPAEVKRDWGDLMAPLIGRDGAVGFHSRMLHWSAWREKWGEMHRNYPPRFTLHSLLLSVGTPSCTAQGQRRWQQRPLCHFKGACQRVSGCRHPSFLLAAPVLLHLQSSQCKSVWSEGCQPAVEGGLKENGDTEKGDAYAPV